MIKYCNKCKYFKPGEAYHEARCFNPIVNKSDYYMLSHNLGESYGTSAMDQRRTKSGFWQNRCGLQGKYWEVKSER